MIALIASLIAYTSAQLYTQMNYHESSSCIGQPTIVSSSLQGQCQIPTLNGQSNLGTSSCQNYDSPIYSSIQTSCNSLPLNLTGIVQLYVARYQWTTSSSCSGDASSVEMVVGDANCHPLSTGAGGLVTQWRLVNCNGGNPIYKVCSDSGCSQCTEAKYNGKCATTSAASSEQVVCIYPSKKNGVNGAGSDEEESGSEKLGFGISMLVGMTLALIF